jgi:hypothetical protein
VVTLYIVMEYLKNKCNYKYGRRTGTGREGKLQSRYPRFLLHYKKVCFCRTCSEHYYTLNTFFFNEDCSYSSRRAADSLGKNFGSVLQNNIILNLR